MFLFTIALFAVFLYYLQDKIYLKYWDKNLESKLTFSPNEIMEGDSAQLIEEIKNAKPLPLSTLHIKFATSKNLNFINEHNSITTDNYYRNDFFSIMGNKKVTRKLDFIGTKRGYHYIDKFDLCCNTIFLTNSIINSVNNSTHIYIFPRKISSKEVPLPIEKVIGEFIYKKSLFEDPFEFRGMREYQPYDNMSSINWKTSAKTNTLIINQHDYTSSLKVELLLNCNVPNFDIESSGEYSIRIVSTIIDKLSKYSIPIGFYCNSYDIDKTTKLDIAIGNGSNHINTINKSLAKINLYGKCDNFANTLNSIKEKNSYKIIISSDYRDEMYNNYKEFKEKNNNTIWIIPKSYNNETIDIANNVDIFIWEVSNND